MPILFLDYETYYDDDYSLRKMTPAEYIMDPRFECIGAACAVDDQPSQWIDGFQVAEYLAQFDPDKTTLVTFNALFDACITNWRFRFNPKQLICSMRMAVALRGHLLDGNASLANVLKVLNLGQKGDAIVHAKGRHRADILNDPVFHRQYMDYACNDNDGNRAIFDHLLPEFPSSERRVMDRVLRAAVEPHFVVDIPMLQQHLADIETQQEQDLIDAGAPTTMTDPDKDVKLSEFARSLRSTAKFEERLKSLGVDIDYKASATDASRLIPAFAKTDEFMANLLESDDPILVALANARLGLRSTIEKSRGERILKIASLGWPEWVEGNMPIPLRFSGAHTHRLSGDWKINMQNLPAGRDPTKPSKLRKALKAPPGYKVLVGDLSQIECRITAWLVKQMDLLNVFANGLDPYSILASDVFGFQVDKNVHKLERFIGKSGVLGLGFRCGPPKFYNMVLRSARGMKMDMNKLMAVWTEGLCQKTVDVYRTKNGNIRQSWYDLDDILRQAWSGQTAPIMWGGTQGRGVVEIGHGYVKGPDGVTMRYEVLPKDLETGELRYRYGKRTHLIHGGKFLENIVQFLARMVIMHAALRLWDRGLKFRLQAHDELVFIVPEAEAEQWKALLLEELRRRPSWAPDLPLDAEADFGDAYGDAK